MEPHEAIIRICFCFFFLNIKLNLKSSLKYLYHFYKQQYIFVTLKYMKCLSLTSEILIAIIETNF